MDKKRILLFLLLAASLRAATQQFGGNPPSIKWKQVNTDTARVIFPAGLEKQALDVSDIVSRLSSITAPTIGGRTKKINIVLQPLPTVANGYVSLGPFRSEFFLTPRQNSFELGSLPWHKTLALHEYRHVQQYSNFRKGLSKAFYYVFGQEGQALANSLSVPDWFFEGDAVYQETIMSDQGRGRLPFFLNDYRSLWAAKKNYSWMKLRNGSYRDLVPNHYHLGYMLVSYGYEKFGSDVWKNVAGDAAAFKNLFYPFQKSFKRNTGQDFISFRREAMDFYRKNSQLPEPDSVARYAESTKHFAGNELYPQWKGSSEIVYLHNDYSRIPAFYVRDITTGSEKKIKNRSISTDDYFSYNNNRIVYSAYEPDVRWRWRNYEVIKVLDVNTGIERRITSKTRYLSPDISFDGTKIVAVNSHLSGANNIEIIDASNGTVLKKIPNPENYVFTYPKFYRDNKVVAAVRNTVGEMALGIFDEDSGTPEWIVPFSNTIIGFPNVKSDTIAFSMTVEGQDRLFVAAVGKIFRFDPSIQNSATGNYQLAAGDGKYAWSAFTAAGYHMFTGDGTLTDAGNNNIAAENPIPLKSIEGKPNLITTAPHGNYEVKKYSSLYGLFNFHSWRPFFSDPDYSYSLIGQNMLNTMLSEIYFTYNRNEKFKETGAIFSYAGLFPVISAGGSFTFDRSFTDSSRVLNWNELNAVARMSVPLSFAGGTFLQNLNISGALNTKQVYYTGASKNFESDKRFNYAEWAVSATNQQITARQNIYPKFAQTLQARYRHIINNYTAHQLLLSTALYFPGFAHNHSIVLQAAYQQRDTLQQYTFTNSFPFSRGYTDIDFPRMWKVGGNYHFPIAYPDAGFGNIVYLLRLRGNVFYDYSEIKSLRTGLTFPFKTAGGEIYFDTKWWNQLALSIGFRYSRLLDNELLGLTPNQYEIILPVNLLNR
ncbi:MAG: hypothetical protein JNK79_11300 [Chitinophagaceae bacterium]|nr:hypothetical protein [Chitinophagaceae bacterium]